MSYLIQAKDTKDKVDSNGHRFFNFVYLQIALDQTPPSPCRMSYAHPPTHVLKQALEAGFVVSCQAFVFATYAPDDGTVNRPNCR